MSTNRLSDEAARIIARRVLAIMRAEVDTYDTSKTAQNASKSVSGDKVEEIPVTVFQRA